jgi:hypothetical protein
VPKLADIGLVAELGEAKSFVGTLGYIPPEGPGTPQADLFSLGKVLYELATGRDRQEFPQLPADLRENSNAALLVEFNEILLKACEPEPRKRYESATQLSAELKVLQRGRSLKHVRTFQKGLAICRKAGWVAALLGLITAAAVFGWRGGGNNVEFHSATPEVDKLVEKGNAALLSSTPSRLGQAGSFFDQAAALEPNFVPARIGLFVVRMQEASVSPYVDSARADANLRIAASNLVQVAPWLGEARIASAFLKCLDGQWADARKDAQRATQMPVASKAGAGLVHNTYTSLDRL